MLLKKSEADKKEFTGIINIAQDAVEPSKPNKAEVMSELMQPLKPKSEPRLVPGKLELQIVKATGCINLGALNPTGFYLELSALSAERKSVSDLIKTKLQELRGEISTAVVSINETVEYDVEGIDANTLPKHIYIKMFMKSGNGEDVFMGECCVPWMRIL